MHAKSKISGMLPKSFNAGKCKTALKLAASRIKLLKNKREVAVKQMRRDLAQLLEAGQEQTARIQVEHVIREENAMSAYDLIEVYCEIIIVRLPIIESQKGCPIDLKEAITSVVFAAPRCTDIPELMDVRKQFTMKYGKEFITAVTEVRPDCGVSRMMVEKLSTKSPNVEVKIEVLKAAAKEHNVTWEPNPFGERIQLPNEDLLVINGPTSFISGNMIMKSLSAHSRDTVPTKRVSENDFATAKPVNSNTVPVNAKDPANLLSSRISERKSSGEEVNHTYSKDESTSMSRSNWNVEFKDATEAAEAAAESAEMASLAARAAAELASRGSFTRHQSADRESLIHAEKNGRSGSLRSSLQNHLIVKESMDNESDKRRCSDDITMDSQYQQKGNMTQVSRSPDAKSLNYRQTKTVEMMQGRFRSSGLSEESGGKQFDHSQKRFSDRSVTANDFNNGINDDHVQISNGKHSKSVPSFGSTSSDDHTIWPDRESITVDSSEVVSVDYESDVDAHSAIEEEEDLLDFLRHGKRQSSRTETHLRESLSTDTSLQMHSVTGRHHSSSSERVVKAGPSYLKNSRSAHDSYGSNYASEEYIEATKPGSLGRQGNYRKDQSADGKRVVEEDIPGSWSASSPDARPGFISRTSQRTSSNISSLSAPDSSKGLSEEEASNSPFSEESSVSGGLNLGRLTGGLRNRSYHRPTYVRNPSTDDSPRSSITSADTSLVDENDVISEITSFEAQTKQKATKESRAKTHAPKLDAYEEQSHKNQVSNQVPYDQKPRTKVNNDPSSRMLNMYSNFDADEVEEHEPRRTTTAARNNDVKHSRRTVGAPQDAKGVSSLRTGGSSELKSPLRSEAETLSMNTRQTKVDQVDHKVRAESKYQHLSAGGSAKSFDNASSASSRQKEKAPNSDRENDGSSKELSSSSTATSRESSLKKASHTHPKLPDYETLAAHFQSLRSNVRQK